MDNEEFGIVGGDLDSEILLLRLQTASPGKVSGGHKALPYGWYPTFIVGTVIDRPLRSM